MLIDSIKNSTNDNELKIDDNLNSDEWYLFTRWCFGITNTLKIWINELKEYT